MQYICQTQSLTYFTAFQSTPEVCEFLSRLTKDKEVFRPRTGVPPSVLILANEIYKQTGTQPEEYLVAKNIMVEINQNINKFFKKDIETGEQCLSDDKYSYMVKIIFDFILTENKDQQNIYFKLTPDYENMNFKIDFYPNGEYPK